MGRIQLKSVTKSFGDVEVIKGIDLEIQDGEFVGVAAPTTFQAEKALAAIAETAKWERGEHPSSEQLYGYLREHARGGVPANPFNEEIDQARATAMDDVTAWCD